MNEERDNKTKYKIEIVDSKFVIEEFKRLFETEIKYNIQWKMWWQRIGNLCGAAAQFSIATSTICAFAAGQFESHTVTFMAGILGTLSLVLIRFGSFALTASEQKKRELNSVLTRLGINIPLIPEDHHDLPERFDNTNNIVRFHL